MTVRFRLAWPWRRNCAVAVCRRNWWPPDPRKRFDKAVKTNTRAILALGFGDEGVTQRLRNVDADAARIEALIA
jgi:hypothetical protein